MSSEVKITYPDAREFSQIVDAVSALIEEANFALASDGLKLRALDPSRTAMIDLLIPKEAFEEFPESLNEEVRIGVNFDDFKKLLRRIRKGDKLGIEVSEGKLKVRLLGKASRTMTLPLIDIGAEELPTPKVVYTVLAKVSSDSLNEALKDADVIADAVKFDAKDDGLYISASSDKGDVEVKFEKEGEVMFEYDLKEPATAKYSLDYLVDTVSKAYRISDIVTIEFATQKPIALTFEIPMGGKLTYYIAPMIE
ncbi:MAG: DNA polymerase [Vulcanisaeta sp. OSP_8]|jgi:monomeric archaeal DNA polymerase sliding clamp|nr:MAG: DNA polymerase [Vulcanisaeta sp. OSP_8]